MSDHDKARTRQDDLLCRWPSGLLQVIRKRQNRDFTRLTVLNINFNIIQCSNWGGGGGDVSRRRSCPAFNLHYVRCREDLIVTYCWPFSLACCCIIQVRVPVRSWLGGAGVQRWHKVSAWYTCMEMLHCIELYPTGVYLCSWGPQNLLKHSNHLRSLGKGVGRGEVGITG